ncbi:MAG TPA: transglycosylase domain-containing protein [Anaerolineales bacterium]
MPSVPQIIRLRQQRREQGESRPAARMGRIGLAFSLVLSFLTALSAIGLTLGFADLTKNLPPPEALAAILEPPNGQLLQPTLLYDRSGEHVIARLQNPAIDERSYIPIDASQSQHLPSSLVDATIASADPEFWSHPGFRLEDFRLAFGSVRGRQPTLAERLASELLLWDEPDSVRRDLRVKLLASQITNRFGQQKVLEWYLNSANYGRLNYGAQAAAQAYFGKSVSEITMEEAAVLAAAAQAPALNPHDSPQSIRERYYDVLQSMRGQGLITEAQFRQAAQKEIAFRPSMQSNFNLAPAFTNLVLEQLAESFDRERILRGGLSIITTLDYDLQMQAECAAANLVARLNDLKTNEIPAIDDSACQAARLLPTIPGSNRTDTIEASANIILLNPKNGQVLTMVGDTTSGLDPAHLPGHPPGSLITPFIYLTGFSRGLTSASLLWDIPTSSPDETGEIENPDGHYHGPVRLRIALANDYLVPASQVMSQMGIQSVLRTAQQLDLNTLIIPSGDAAHRLPLEGGEVTLLDIAQAYGVFANNGVLSGKTTINGQTNGFMPLNPAAVIKVSDLQGRDWLDCDELQRQCAIQSRPVISAQLAYLMTHILSDETARWSSLGHPNPLEIGRPAAAKIGQLKSGTEAWTVGYTPSLVAGVWLGNGLSNNGTRIPSAGAAGLWHAIMQYATRNTPSEDWDVPAGISTISVCDPSGLLPTQECPVVVSEVFQSGNEPTHADNLYQTFQINRESGNLATIFTSPAVIEERVYMLVPPEAEDWARQIGIPIAPTSYDAIGAAEAPVETAQITSPQMFASVKGRVVIQGNAGGSGFSFYRLQIGQGLNPGQWIQVGEDKGDPVTSDQLAVWDTSGLSGLYALQLLVVRGEQQVDTHSLQVRVDNEAPEVEIRYPQAGQRFNYPQDRVITFQVDASDNLGLAVLEFIVDGELINTLAIPPFTVPWDASPGTHTLSVVAEDGAGNQSESALRFVVER